MTFKPGQSGNPLDRWNREPFPGTAPADMPPGAPAVEEGLQIVADSEGGGAAAASG